MQQDGSEISISSVAARARVHRSFIHRHTDLRAEIYAAADNTAPLPTTATVSRRTLEADNLNLRETIRRQARHITDLETRLSELIGEQTTPAPGSAPHRAMLPWKNKSPPCRSNCKTSARHFRAGKRNSAPPAKCTASS